MDASSSFLVWKLFYNAMLLLLCDGAWYVVIKLVFMLFSMVLSDPP